MFLWDINEQKNCTYIVNKIYPFTWNSITGIAIFEGHENGAHENGAHENSEEMIQRDLPESNGEFVHQVLATLHWKKKLIYLWSHLLVNLDMEFIIDMEYFDGVS